MAPVDQGRYGRHMDCLVAAILYLGTSTDGWSRTVASLSRDLSIDAAALQRCLDAFPGLFRRSRSEDAEGAPFYALQLRYAERRQRDDGAGYEYPPLSVAQVALLTDFVLHAAEAERTARVAARQNWIAVGAALAAAASALLSAALAASQS